MANLCDYYLQLKRREFLVQKVIKTILTERRVAFPLYQKGAEPHNLMILFTNEEIIKMIDLSRKSENGSNFFDDYIEKNEGLKLYLGTTFKKLTVEEVPLVEANSIWKVYKLSDETGKRLLNEPALKNYVFQNLPPRTTLVYEKGITPPKYAIRFYKSPHLDVNIKKLFKENATIIPWQGSIKN